MKSVVSGAIVFGIVFTVFIITLIHPVFPDRSPSAVEGKLDLSAWSFSEDGKVKLKGEWELYDGQLLAPEDFAGHGESEPVLTGFVTIASAKPSSGEGVNPKGVRTYRLLVETSGSKQSLGIKLTNVAMSSKLFVNGEMLGQNGYVAAKDKGYQARPAPYQVFFSNEGKRLEIVLQSANFDLPFYPFNFSVLLGSQHSIANQTTITSAIELSGAALCFVFALYFVCLFYTISHMKSALYLAIHFSSTSVLFLCAGEVFIYTVFPDLSIEVFSKILPVISIATPMTIIAYFTHQAIAGKVAKVMQVLLLVIGCILLATPFGVIRVGMVGIQILQEILSLYIIWRLIGLYRQSRPQSAQRVHIVLYILCLGLFTISFMNNTLYILGWASSKGIGSIAIAAFMMLSQSSLAFWFTRNYNKMMEMDKVKDEFIINTSYELKAPISSMARMAESIVAEARKGAYSNDKAILDAEMTNQVANRLLTIVNTTLDVTLLRNHQLKLIPSVIDMRVCAELAIEEAKHLAANKRIAFTMDIPESLLVEADETRVRQVLMNLLSNAVKSMERGSIHIQARRAGGSIHVSIEDTGEGIQEAHWEAIFKPYIALKSQGIGLGLYVSRQLVELMGGRIRVEWSEPGKGSRIGFRLPRHDRYSSRTASPGKSTIKRLLDSAPAHIEEVGAAPTKGTILVVDDELFNIQSAVNMLKHAGYRLLIAYSGEEAMQRVAENEIDLIILDVMLPGKSGITICNQIRESYSLIELPILMSTVGLAEYDLELGIRAGANDFIAKPFEEKQVLARVNGLISLKKAMADAVNSELAFLQAQIQPHFIYNAINTIVSFCYIDSAKAADLLVDFSKYLRLTFDIDPLTTKIPLAREIEMIGVYMAIEQARFGDRFRLESDIEEELMEQSIPPLCIQPLVENALKHGLYGKEEGGVVYLSVKKENDALIIRVRDTGIGMTEEQIAQLTHADQNAGGVGFANIHRRIRRFKNATIRISSAKGAGTTVVLSFQLQH